MVGRKRRRKMKRGRLHGPASKLCAGPLQSAGVGRGHNRPDDVFPTDISGEDRTFSLQVNTVHRR
ncbi:hypothetical protein EYF80_044922 [Liparis tanakae]|uniref:Uncharacterized protein n=1 Tax=Liparis tanakae TaxID=230148 RepID=A0A4Z2FX18_9TELE|nr:hypothetical protein EYF80_044922 [Liparis tanakae]